jgi:hypothetical protein
MSEAFRIPWHSRFPVPPSAQSDCGAPDLDAARCIAAQRPLASRFAAAACTCLDLVCGVSAHFRSSLVLGRDTPIGPWCLVSRCDGCAPGVGVSHTLTTQYTPYCSFILTDTAGTDSVQIHGTLAAAAWARSKRRGPRRTIQRGRGSSRLVREAR